ncbi:BZ3500_MvSof-1268-A1-R1_Chr5-2g07805 [Microbotryum saponariae]|uniref:BZ3500_MvSof-1268-A1-R1_Chr5-2g07805 protein n=1 Tax=Microbotryum saponariae TaxID=289078 RepID=A0A2X0KGJ9_9BASI|nr:BZ3500_MvSof-1268-A1-R1_Chr5-2g07805 [Microbotryum saponariae]SDA05674.1 BZ3501_MvSof-1269-A2-R1_Chr5-2g07627 [Microbotryum saponariae]
MSSSRSMLNLRATTSDGDSSTHALPQSSVPSSPWLPAASTPSNSPMTGSTSKSLPLLSIPTFFTRAKVTRRQEFPPALTSLGQIVGPQPVVLTGESFTVARRPRSSSLSHTASRRAHAMKASALPSSPRVPQRCISTPEPRFLTALVEADSFCSSHEETRSCSSSSHSSKYRPVRHPNGSSPAVSAPVTPSVLSSPSPSSIVHARRDRHRYPANQVQTSSSSLNSNVSEPVMHRPRSTTKHARMPLACRAGSHTSSNSSSSSSPVRSSTESATNPSEHLQGSPIAKRLKRRGVVIDVEAGDEPLSSPELTAISLSSTPRSSPDTPGFKRVLSAMTGQNDVRANEDFVAFSSATRQRSSSVPAPSRLAVNTQPIVIVPAYKQRLAPPFPIGRPLLAQLQLRDVTSSFASTISTTSTEADLKTAQVVQARVESAVRASVEIISGTLTDPRTEEANRHCSGIVLVEQSPSSLEDCTLEDLMTKIHQLEEQKRALEAALESMRVNCQ